MRPYEIVRNLVDETFHEVRHDAVNASSDHLHASSISSMYDSA